MRSRMMRMWECAGEEEKRMGTGWAT
jgi:hypothetical protein